jgi:hypothetical protein
MRSLFKAPAPAGGQHPPVGLQRRQWLANATPPFFIGGLNGWSNNGRGFFENFFQRLHPGLSDEEDSTFRLHLMLLA